MFPNQERCREEYLVTGRRDRFGKFCHWNLNSICARDGLKFPLIQTYNTVYRYDLLALSETISNSLVENDDIAIEGFGKNISTVIILAVKKLGLLVSIVVPPLPKD